MSTSAQSSEGDELQYIYAILRKLKYVRQAEPNQRSRKLNADLYPRRFLLKILEVKFTDLNELAQSFVTDLFKRLAGKRIKRQIYNDNDDSALLHKRHYLIKSKCPELDEYFHNSLYYVYEFIIEFDWHEADVENLSKSDSNYVKSKLGQVSKFLSFQKTLDTLRGQKFEVPTATNATTIDSKTKPTEGTTASAAKSTLTSPPTPIRATKSILPSTVSRIDSPRRRRTVRFPDSPPEDQTAAKESRPSAKPSDRYLEESQSIFALDLLIYALHLFAQQLYTKLVDWAAAESADLRKSLVLVKESKHKIRTNQLASISKHIKSSNDVHLTIIELLSELREVYLIDYVLGIICGRDTERMLNLYKIPRVTIFIQNMGFDLEKRILARLADQSLQLLLDLVVSEINLPPVELDAATKDKSKEEIVKGRENYFNFIASWLNIDDVVFGHLIPKTKRSSSSTGSKPFPSAAIATTERQKQPPPSPMAKVSTLATAEGQFKSSSRILAQMDNLNELMRDLLDEMVDRLVQSSEQLGYFLELMHAGVEQSFDILGSQLGAQLDAARTREPSRPAEEKRTIPQSATDVRAITRSLDMIAAKIRCLKTIHIMTSLDQLIKESASKGKVSLKESSLETKLAEFTDRCTKQTGSDYVGGGG